MNKPINTMASSQHPSLSPSCEVLLHEEHEHVSYIEVGGSAPLYMVIAKKLDESSIEADLTLEQCGAYVFVEDPYRFTSQDEARTRCEEYERDWRSHDCAFEEQRQTLEWRAFLEQPVNALALANTYGIDENTILDYIDDVSGVKARSAITNGDITAIIEQRRAETLTSRDGDSYIRTRRLPRDGNGTPFYEAFSMRLSTFFRGEVEGLLTEMVLNGEAVSFLMGGCRIAARGLQIWIKATPAQLRVWGVDVPGEPTAPSSRLFSVTDHWYHPKHVVAEVEGLFLDAGGVSTAGDLLTRYGQRYKDPRIVAYNASKLTRHGIRADEDMSQELAKWLAREFGMFQLSFLRCADERGEACVSLNKNALKTGGESHKR